MDTPSGAGREEGESAKDVRQVAGERGLQEAGEMGVDGAAVEEHVARKGEDYELNSELLEAADSRRDLGMEEDVARMTKGAASTAEDEARRADVEVVTALRSIVYLSCSLRCVSIYTYAGVVTTVTALRSNEMAHVLKSQYLVAHIVC